MFIQIKNENSGYAVATYGDYVVVSNPDTVRYSFDTASVVHTGSVDYYRYNKSTDQHDLVGQLHFTAPDINILLSVESGSTPTLYAPLHTEDNNTGESDDKDLEIDKNAYTSSLENGFGTAVDMYDKLLIVGSPHFLESVSTSASQFLVSGSQVEVFDLSQTEFVTFLTGSNPTVFIGDNPDPTVSESFGRAVSINNGWLAVGSPHVSASKGMVYLYRNTSTGSTYDWTLFQKLEASGSTAGSQFGNSLKLNKQSGSYSGSLIVGFGSLMQNEAHYFEFISGSWTASYVFRPDTTTPYPLTFGEFDPYTVNMNVTNGYGYSVSTYGTTVIIGEYLDRSVYEFSGSDATEQGSISIYERCPSSTTRFDLVLKTYGTSSIMKNNRLGYSVDVFGNNAVAGIPKINNLSMTSCFIGGTLQQLHQCPDDLEKELNGQVMLLQKNTSSLDWEIVNIYQRKKRFLNPYRDFGNSVAIDGRSFVVGAPMVLFDDNREVNIYVTESNGATLGDVSGKAYIYNLANLRDQFHVGNVFYRNGKIVLMTSGSVFDGLFFNPINVNTYQYDLSFKGQHTIFEKQVVCSVSPGEFNVSTNPSAVMRPSSSLDINQNGFFDFQDVDVILRYMQYKNTSRLGLTISTDWSSSIVTADDEISVLNYYQSSANYDAEHTSVMASESIVRWETEDTWMQNVLDLNQDNRIDVRDMNIVWKYFTNRLTQENYSSFITPSCQRKLFSDIIDYMNFLSQRTAKPQIKSQFLDYERLASNDKTGSFSAPLVTTIGIYSGLDLIAVAKLGSPIKITPELPINFVVKMDY
jgi:hypothetical protein